MALPDSNSDGDKFGFCFDEYEEICNEIWDMMLIWLEVNIRFDDMNDVIIYDDDWRYSMIFHNDYFVYLSNN